MLHKDAVGHYLLNEEQVFLTSYAWYITGDFQASEDLFQDLVVKALTSNEAFRDFAHLRHWSKTVVRNAALNLMRDRGRHPVLLMEEKVLDALARDWHSMEEKEREAYRVPLEALSRCVKRLNPRNQELVQLRYCQGLSSGEIANHLKRKVETVYRAIARLHSKLRDCVSNQLAQEGGL